jgi:hypothetical protein
MSVDWPMHARRAIHRLGDGDNPDDGHVVKLASGGPHDPVRGVFNSAGITVLDDMTPGVLSSQPSFRAMADELIGVSVGDTLVHDGIDYRIATKPDPEQPSGHITMKLQRKE